ncbi:hypothetical protein, partial [uncultured Duncaniella sp.]|uniref:hypothetical protein n=1 Tax=uncultured Duncaniella sp. TaxID=2768039 RepID=UPI0027313D54
MVSAGKLSAPSLGNPQKKRYLCTALGIIHSDGFWAKGLSYGVMVALQFLVLPVLVRIQVRQ